MSVGLAEMTLALRLEWQLVAIAASQTQPVIVRALFREPTNSDSATNLWLSTLFGSYSWIDLSISKSLLQTHRVHGDT